MGLFGPMPDTEWIQTQAGPMSVAQEEVQDSEADSATIPVPP